MSVYYKGQQYTRAFQAGNEIVRVERGGVAYQIPPVAGVNPFRVETADFTIAGLGPTRRLIPDEFTLELLKAPYTPATVHALSMQLYDDNNVAQHSAYGGAFGSGSDWQVTSTVNAFLYRPTAFPSDWRVSSNDVLKASIDFTDSGGIRRQFEAELEVTYVLPAAPTGTGRVVISQINAGAGTATATADVPTGGLTSNYRFELRPPAPHNNILQVRNESTNVWKITGLHRRTAYRIRYQPSYFAAAGAWSRYTDFTVN